MQNLPNHWIMLRLSAMGDVALTTGVLDFWHQEHGLRFTVVTREACAPLFRNHPAVDAVVGLGKADLRLQNLLQVWATLNANHKGSGLLDLHGTLRSTLLATLWQGPVRRYPKLALQRRAFLLSRGRLCAEPLLRWNVPQRYAMALKELLPGTEPPARERLLPHIVLDEDEKRAGQELLLAAGFDADCRPVALHPYATHANKAWPRASWQALCQCLDTAGIPWVVLGRSQTDQNLATTADSLQTRSNDLTNKTSLRETCALLSLCRGLVTGDSGPMHLASGVGTPVVALFGPTTTHWGFFPPAAHDTVLEMPCPCRPCSLHGRTPCHRGLRCLADISVERVMKALDRLINKEEGKAKFTGVESAGLTDKDSRDDKAARQKNSL